MYKSCYNDVWFIEGDFKEATVIKKIKVELNGFLTNNQLKSLDDVKKVMARKAQTYQCNAVINFKYGQKSAFLQSIFGMDDVFWYGSGDLAKIDIELLNDK